MAEKALNEARKQQDKLGFLLSQLQLKKERQMCQMDQQEDALEELTSCMVEDLTERGVVSNPDCNRIIERHVEDKKRFGEKLESQKERQQLQLRQQLEERALRRRATGQNFRKKQMEKLRRRSLPSTVAKSISELNLLVQQTVTEQSQTKDMERRLEQSFQEQRKEFQKELTFVGNLIEMGDFKKSEVSRVLKLVFPQKTQTEVQVLVRKVFGNIPDRRPRERTSEREHSRLEKKVLSNQTQRMEFNKRLSPTKKKKMKRKRRTTWLSSSSESSSRPHTALPPISRRPEPVGASVDQIAEYLPPRRLAKVAGTYHS